MALLDYITETGLVVPDTSTLLDAEQKAWKGAFGNDLDVNPETPQGVMMQMAVAGQEDILRSMAAIAMQLNPDRAGGAWLDAIFRLTGGTRLIETFSTVSADVRGVPGITLPAGSAAKSRDGSVWRLRNLTPLDASGWAVGEFVCTTAGHVQCGAGELDRIAEGGAVIGWETVHNPSPAKPGVARETDSALRLRREGVIAAQGNGTIYNIYSRLALLPGVQSLVARENIAPQRADVDGISIAAHGAWVCIDGGADADIASELLRCKSSGSAWEGGHAVIVTEPVSGQVYSVHFDRPALVRVYARVTVDRARLQADEAWVKRSLAEYAAGSVPGERGLTVGRHCSAFELAGALNILQSSTFVRDVQISTDGATWIAGTIPVTLRQKATIAVADVEVHFV